MKLTTKDKDFLEALAEFVDDTTRANIALNMSGCPDCLTSHFFFSLSCEEMISRFTAYLKVSLDATTSDDETAHPSPTQTGGSSYH